MPAVPQRSWAPRLLTATRSTVRPLSADAEAKPASPIRNVRRRPKVSASRPPSRSRPPKATCRRSPPTVRSATEKCSPRCAEGNAMSMTVASRATINWATEMHTSASQRREDCAACARSCRFLLARVWS